MLEDSIISSSEIRFRATQADDLDFVLETEQHPDSRDFICLWSREKHLESVMNSDHLHLIIANMEGQRIGYLILAGLTNANSCIELIRINIGMKGNGYGRKSIKLLQEYLFNHLQVHRLWLDVKTNNHRALNLYHSTGFIEEGILRECIKTGDRYESLIIMGMLKSELLQ